MNRLKTISCFFITLILVAHLHAQQKPVIMIVHGAFGGSWAFKKVDSLLTEKGCVVYRPSMTGLGERSHLSNANIGLQTHINDVVNMILFEDLHDVVLIGHSYGGMVVTGVADSLPDRIKKVIYLDAFYPENGESVFSMNNETMENTRRVMKDGYAIPTWLKPGTPLPHDVPHPLKTLTDKIVLKNRIKNIPKVYILTVDKEREAKNDSFFSSSERARKQGWPVIQMSADHNPQWSAPVELSELFFKNK